MHTYSYTAELCSHNFLPTNIHTLHYINTHTHHFSISRFLYFWNFHISVNQEIWKFQKYRNSEKWNHVCLSAGMYVVCMQVYMYLCMYVCIYVCMYVCTEMVEGTRNTEIQKSKIMYVCSQACMFVCMHVYMYLCIHACMHVYMCVCTEMEIE